jgi:hypothetical protein
MIKLPNKYNFEARYVPSLACSIPFFLFGYYFFSGIDNAFWSSVAGITVGGVSISAVMLVVMVNFCRNLGKLIEEKLFKDGLEFPTTTFLLDTDTNLSISMKKAVIKKIKHQFNIDLKIEDTIDNRRLINEAVRRINSKFFGKNDLLLQRTIQFGFTKNILAGAIIATAVSILGIIVSVALHNIPAMYAATLLTLIYMCVGLVSFASVRFIARHYAQALYVEFMAVE